MFFFHFWLFVLVLSFSLHRCCSCVNLIDMFSSFQTVLYAPPPFPFCCVLPFDQFCACSSCDFVMWLLHGADDVVFADQQKVMFVFFLSALIRKYFMFIFIWLKLLD